MPWRVVAMARHATLTRLGDFLDGLTQWTATLVAIVVTLALIGFSGFAAFSILIQLWSGRWPW